MLCLLLIKSSDQCNFDRIQDTIIVPQHRGGGGGGGMWPIIDTRCEDFSALVCLLTFGFIKSSDQCDFDHFKFQLLLLPKHWGQK